MQDVLVHVLSRYKTIERQVNTKKPLPIYPNKRKKSSNARKECATLQAWMSYTLNE